MEYRLDGSLFNIRRLQAHTKTSTDHIHELQYADDCAIVAHTPESMQHALDTISALYTSFGLQVNTKKTEIMAQLCTESSSPATFYINGNPLNIVDQFTYLGCTVSADTCLDSEIHNRINKASSAFGRLRKRVFDNKNLKISTKVAVYNAVCVSTLLYGAETWTPYRRHIKSLEMFHIRCLQKILSLSWEDRIPHTDILSTTGTISMEAALANRHLRWVGHTIRMPGYRLPHQVLYGQLPASKRAPGGQKRRYKDYTKDLLRHCNINPGHLEDLAANRPAWRKTCKKATEQINNIFIERRTTRRAQRHQKAEDNSSQTSGHACSICGRVCGSKIGLHSHMRWHQRQTTLTPPLPQPPS